MNFFDRAMELVDFGYKVFPVQPEGKRPLCNNGCNEATNDEGIIGRWADRWPTARIGVSTSGLVVVDIDPGSPPGWPGAERSMDPSWLAAPMSKTPRGGWHLYFRDTLGARCSAGKLSAGVDIRATGGYIISPNSAGYSAVPTRELVPVDELPDPPPWLSDWLRNGGSNRSSAGRVSVAPQEAPGWHGRRNSTLTAIAGSLRRYGLPEAALAQCLESINATCCHAPLPEKEVASIAGSIARYPADPILVAPEPGAPEAPEPIKTPAPIDPKLLRLPGLGGQIMDLCMDTAPYPNQTLAFCGALALLSHITGRAVEDSSGVRTNLYILSLAYSGVGKNHPRAVNTAILHRAGVTPEVGGAFASGEGIQDALFLTPRLLLQVDEIDGILRSMKSTVDYRTESILTTLLQMATSSSSVFPMRKKAGRESAGIINDPHLTLLGNAIPNHYYSALSERLLTNGFFARTITFDCEGRGTRNPKSRGVEVPDSILEPVIDWISGEYGGVAPGDAAKPGPRRMEYSIGAQAVLAECYSRAEAEYQAAEKAGDPVGTTIWARIPEMARKLAMLWQCSANAGDWISEDAVRWAVDIAIQQGDRSAYMAKVYVADTEFQEKALKVFRMLEKPMTYSGILRKMKIPSRELKELLSTMEERGELQLFTEATKGRSRTCYRRCYPKK